MLLLCWEGDLDKLCLYVSIILQLLTLHIIGSYGGGVMEFGAWLTEALCWGIRPIKICLNCHHHSLFWDSNPQLSHLF